MWKHAARTDPGRKRAHNEDSLLLLPDAGIFVVADGVGGRAAGEVASALCVDAFRDSETALTNRIKAFEDAPSLETRNAVLSAMDEVLQLASRRIYETAESEGRGGMTTTVVAVVVTRGAAFLAHVGDSRAYLARDGELRQLTEDHSMVNELVRTGKMTYEEARQSRHRHVITRAVGLYPTVQPSLASVDLLPGDRLLLCSDGLSDVVPPALLLEEASGADLEVAVDRLLLAALDRGGPDNVTFILLDAGGNERGDEVAARAGMLEAIFLFEDLPYAARLQVGRILQEHYFAPGDVLVHQGSPGTSLYVLLDGEVAVSVSGREVARLGAGEHFGELSLVDAQPRSATITAVGFGSAISVSAEQLQEFCRREPELGNDVLWRMMRVLGQRLRQTNAQIAGAVPL